MTVTAYPVAPTVTPRLGTLLDAATVLGQDSFKWNDGVEQFASFNCMKFDSDPTFCGPNNKTAVPGIGYQDGVRFGAYGLISCRSVGIDFGEMEREAGRVFETGESTAVEQGLMATRFIANAAGSGLPGAWTAPTDITPAAGAVKPAVGVALLEGHAASNYVGTPTIHLPVTIASLILGADGAAFEGPVLRTKLGSKMAAGAGYDFPNNGPTGAAAATGEKWLYATGEVVVIRSDMVLQQALDTNTNDVFVLAERGYIVTVDCYASAVRVQVTS